MNHQGLVLLLMSVVPQPGPTIVEDEVAVIEFNQRVDFERQPTQTWRTIYFWGYYSIPRAGGVMSRELHLVDWRFEFSDSAYIIQPHGTRRASLTFIDRPSRYQGPDKLRRVIADRIIETETMHCLQHEDAVHIPWSDLRRLTGSEAWCYCEEF